MFELGLGVYIASRFYAAHQRLAAQGFKTFDDEQARTHFARDREYFLGGLRADMRRLDWR